MNKSTTLGCLGKAQLFETNNARAEAKSAVIRPNVLIEVIRKLSSVRGSLLVRVRPPGND